MNPLEDAAHQMISYRNKHMESNFQGHCGFLRDAYLMMKAECPKPFGSCKNPSHDLSILAKVPSPESC